MTVKELQGILENISGYMPNTPEMPVVLQIGDVTGDLEVVKDAGVGGGSNRVLKVHLWAKTPHPLAHQSQEQRDAQ